MLNPVGQCHHASHQIDDCIVELTELRTSEEGLADEAKLEEIARKIDENLSILNRYQKTVTEEQEDLQDGCLSTKRTNLGGAQFLSVASKIASFSGLILESLQLGPLSNTAGLCLGIGGIVMDGGAQIYIIKVNIESNILSELSSYVQAVIIKGQVFKENLNEYRKINEKELPANGKLEMPEEALEAEIPASIPMEKQEAPRKNRTIKAHLPLVQNWKETTSQIYNCIFAFNTQIPISSKDLDQKTGLVWEKQVDNIAIELDKNLFTLNQLIGRIEQEKEDVQTNCFAFRKGSLAAAVLLITASKVFVLTGLILISFQFNPRINTIGLIMGTCGIFVDGVAQVYITKISFDSNYLIELNAIDQTAADQAEHFKEFLREYREIQIGERMSSSTDDLESKVEDLEGKIGGCMNAYASLDPGHQDTKAYHCIFNHIIHRLPKEDPLLVQMDHFKTNHQGKKRKQRKITLASLDRQAFIEDEIRVETRSKSKSAPTSRDIETLAELTKERLNLKKPLEGFYINGQFYDRK